MSYRTKVQDRGEEAPDKDPANDPMNCPLCNGLTKRGTLSTYGARCFRCYEAYCQARPEPREPSPYAQKVRAFNEALRRGRA